MQDKRSNRRFLFVPVALLVCMVALSIFLFTGGSASAALSPFAHRTPTPQPTATPTPTTGVTPTVTTGGISCQVTYANDAQFSGGFLAELGVTNTGSTAIVGWTLQFAFPDGQVITSSFNANFTQVGANVTAVSRSYNGTILPGGSVLAPPGFNATWNNIANDPPAVITLNGTPCVVIATTNG